MTNEENNNGVFIQEQEDLSEDVYNALIYKPRARKISLEMDEFLRGVK